MTADVTGTVRETFDGTEYSLRLTMRGLAKLQAKHGANVAGLLDGTAGNPPNMEPLLDMVSEALQKGHGLEQAEADDVADELLTADLGLVERLIQAAFPDAEVSVEKGNRKRSRRAA